MPIKEILFAHWSINIMTGHCLKTHLSSRAHGLSADLLRRIRMPSILKQSTVYYGARGLNPMYLHKFIPRTLFLSLAKQSVSISYQLGIWTFFNSCISGWVRRPCRWNLIQSQSYCPHCVLLSIKCKSITISLVEREGGLGRDGNPQAIPTHT